MKNHILIMREVDRSIFNDVLDGSKTIETRAATDKYRSVQAGDTITFKCGDDRVIKTVSASQHFDTLEELFDHISMAKILPAAKTIDDARKIYYSFPGYEEKLAKHGIMAFILD